jgi:phage protein D
MLSKAERFKIRRARYRSSEKGKATERAYNQSAKGKAVYRKSQAKYLRTPEGKAKHDAWMNSHRERLKQLSKIRNARPEVKLRERIRKLLQKYGESALQAIERDEGRCVKCNSTTRICIHHNDWDQWNNALENLVCLCSRCHNGLHVYLPKRLRLEVYDEYMKTSICEITGVTP